jgi:hypothetical protein
MKRFVAKRVDDAAAQMSGTQADQRTVSTRAGRGMGSGRCSQDSDIAEKAQTLKNRRRVTSKKHMSRGKSTPVTVPSPVNVDGVQNPCEIPRYPHIDLGDNYPQPCFESLVFEHGSGTSCMLDSWRCGCVLVHVVVQGLCRRMRCRPVGHP